MPHGCKKEAGGQDLGVSDMEFELAQSTPLIPPLPTLPRLTAYLVGSPSNGVEVPVESPDLRQRAPSQYWATHGKDRAQSTHIANGRAGEWNVSTGQRTSEV
eukprot:3343670-Rhodomonas_salina.12